jgi:hypothetical protein
VTPGIDGDREQQIGVHGLQVAGTPGSHPNRPRRGSWRRDLVGMWVLTGDGGPGVGLDPPIDGVDLDGVHEVVGVEDDHSQTGEQEHDGAADGQPRIGLGAHSGLQADREQTGGAVNECGDEHAQHQLRRPIPEEVAQHPR